MAADTPAAAITPDSAAAADAAFSIPALPSDVTIALIGGGKMGEAIMGGLIRSSSPFAAGLSADSFIVANPGEARRSYLQEEYGVRCVASAREIPAASIVILAVKPQVMGGVLEEIRAAGNFDTSLFISIAAGLATARFCQELSLRSRVVRTMPNTPLLVGAGVTAVCASSRCTPADVELVRSLFACLGQAYVVDESLVDAVGAVSGSGPAYVASLVEHLAHAGELAGLDAALAEQLAFGTLCGTARLMTEREQSAEETRVSVCSPGGSTLAALAAMDNAGIADVYAAGVAAAVRRSKELGAC